MVPITFDSYNHTGIVVKDAEAAAESYTKKLGAGPWKFRDAGSLILAHGNIGTLLYEILQPKEGMDSLWAAFLAEHGEGLHHISYNVADVDKGIAELIEVGGKVTVYNGRPIATPGRFAYIEIGGPASIIVELLKTPEEK